MSFMCGVHVVHVHIPLCNIGDLITEVLTQAHVRGLLVGLFQCQMRYVPKKQHHNLQTRHMLTNCEFLERTLPKET